MCLLAMSEKPESFNSGSEREHGQEKDRTEAQMEEQQEAEGECVEIEGGGRSREPSVRGVLQAPENRS